MVLKELETYPNFKRPLPPPFEQHGPFIPLLVLLCTQSLVWTMRATPRRVLVSSIHRHQALSSRCASAVHRPAQSQHGQIQPSPPSLPTFLPARLKSHSRSSHRSYAALATSKSPSDDPLGEVPAVPSIRKAVPGSQMLRNLLLDMESLLKDEVGDAIWANRVREAAEDLENVRRGRIAGE